MLCLAYVDTLYLISALLIFSVPLLWPRVATTWTFTIMITYLLPVAHITLNGRGTLSDDVEIIITIFV